MDCNSLQQVACDAIDSAAEELNFLSQEIWKNPELADEEFCAHDLLTDFLEKKNFKVERKWLLETAFRATYGDPSTDGPHVAVLCEYDALPEIGHACGHNLIAEVGIATGLAIKAVLEVNKTGRLTVMGTPAEEHNGGKVRMIKAGAFSDVDFAMMAHPSKYELLKPNYCAVNEVVINYKGRESHAAEWPWHGVNALDAAVLCYQNISCLRQQMVPNWMVHGIITKGGQRPNIIPGNTQLEYYIRCPTTAELRIFDNKVKKCAEAAAHATGCEMEYIYGESYESLMSNEPLITLYEKYGESLGIQFERNEIIVKKMGGSSDMGNVSHVVPSVHPEFRIGADCNSHTQEFAPAAGSAAAQQNTLAVAKALSMTAIHVLSDPNMLEMVKQDFQNGLEREEKLNTTLM